MDSKKINRNRFNKIFPIINQLNDNMLADKIVNIWDKIEDVCFSPDIKNQPLINHINVTTIVALKMAEQIEMVQKIKFDKDLIISIGLLHDVSKLIEYQPDINNNYKKSEIGGKIQHAFLGALFAYNEDLSTDIIHLILTHTPKSKMKPMVKEGILFSYMDLCDADMIFYDNNYPLFLKE